MSSNYKPPAYIDPRMIFSPECADWGYSVECMTDDGSLWYPATYWTTFEEVKAWLMFIARDLSIRNGKIEWNPVYKPINGEAVAYIPPDETSSNPKRQRKNFIRVRRVRPMPSLISTEDEENGRESLSPYAQLPNSTMQRGSTGQSDNVPPPLAQSTVATTGETLPGLSVERSEPGMPPRIPAVAPGSDHDSAKGGRRRGK